MNICKHEYDCACRMELLRSIKLRRKINKMKKLKHRKLFSFWKPPKFLKVSMQLPKPRLRWARISIRSQTGRDLRIRKSLEDALALPGFVAYQPDAGSKKRRATTKTRQELDEKNPYCFPVEGVTHKFRLASSIITKVRKKWEKTLAIHERPNHSFRHNMKVVHLLRKILSPGSIFPVRIRLFPERRICPEEGGAVPRDCYPKQHVQVWKEIELTRILVRYKDEDVTRMGAETASWERAMLVSQKQLASDAKRLEQLYASSGSGPHDAARELEQLLDRRRVQSDRSNELSAQAAALRIQVLRLIDTLEELRVMQAFLYKVSPESWVEEHGGLKEPRMAIFNEETDDLCSLDLGWLRCSNHLYFSSPDQLTGVFNELVGQNLTVIQYVIQTELSVDHMTSYVHNFRKAFTEETEALRKRVASMQENLFWQEENVRQLTETADMYSYGSFQDAVQEEAALDITGLVEKAFREVVGGEQSNLNPVQMLGAIERRYNTLLLEIDIFPPAIMAVVVNQFNLQRHRANKEEREKNRRTVEFLRLIGRLKRALEPPSLRTRGKPLKPRSEPPKPPRPKLITPEVDLAFTGAMKNALYLT